MVVPVVLYRPDYEDTGVPVEGTHLITLSASRVDKKLINDISSNPLVGQTTGDVISHVLLSDHGKRETTIYITGYFVDIAGGLTADQQEKKLYDFLATGWRNSGSVYKRAYQLDYAERSKDGGDAWFGSITNYDTTQEGGQANQITYYIVFTCGQEII